MAIEKRIGAYTAYAIAVENGFTGTEKEWLESLIGPRGYQGWGVSAVSVSADGSLIFTIQNPESGETRELEPIQIETLNALNSISTAKDEAVNEVKKSQTQATEAVGTAKTQAVQAVEDAENTGVSAVEDARSNALTEIGEAKTTAVDAVNAAGTQAASDAQTAITTAKNQAVSDVQNAGQSAVGAVGDARTTAVEAVEDAQTNAVQAVENAGTAEIEKINDILPVPTKADNGKILTVVDGKWAARDPGYLTETWADIQKIVRLGAAPRYFPVGYEFVTHDSTNDTDIIWRVVGYDTIQAADESLSHTMVLETKYVYSISSAGTGARRCFDEKEAIYYVEDGLDPGTYYFTIPAGYGGNKEAVETSISFTLAQPVPAGGVIVYSLPMNKIISNDYKMETYSSQISTDPIEEVSVSVGVNGTNLGIADGSVQNTNHCDRAIGGSNNYAQSAIRQLLNSSADASEFWTPQTRFDMVPSWHDKQPGIMARFPADFLAVVQPAIVKCCTNRIYETDSLDGTVVAKDQVYALHDRFFLLSGVEIYGTEQGTDQRLGEMLEFYDGLTNTEKIKHDMNGSSSYSWLRDAPITSTCNVRYISGVYGSFSGSNASFTTPSFTIACIIA